MLGQVTLVRTSAKSPGSAPAVAGAPVRYVGSVPEFENVRVKVLDWPSSTFPKFIGLGDSARRAFTPVPDKVT